MAIELASAYVTLIPSLKGAQKSIESQLAGLNLAPAGNSMGSSLAKGISGGDLLGAVSKTGSFLSGTFGRASKVAVGAITGVGTALGGLAVTGGLTRALNIEKAQTMFKGLKLQWDDYRDTINDAVTGTAFTMDAAALTAAGLAASGVEAGESMEKALNGAVGTAATFGSSLEDIGGIYSKVAAQGKLSGEIVQQFADRGINVTSILSEQLGKSGDEVKKLVSEGKIDFQTFSDAMYAAFGDSAQAANETFTGSLANMRSAVSRFGEKFMTPIKDSAIPVFNAAREAINSVSAASAPLVERFTQLADVASGKLSGGLTAFKDAMEAGEGPAQAVAAAIDAIGGSGAATRIQTVVAGFLAMAVVGPVLTSAAEGAKKATAGFDKAMGALKPFGSALKGAADGIGSFSKRLVVAGASASREFGTALARGFTPKYILDKLDAIPDAASSAFGRMKWNAESRLGEVASSVSVKFGGIAAAIDDKLGGVPGRIGGIASDIAGRLGLAAEMGSSVFKSKFKLAGAAEGEAGLLSRALDKAKGAAKGAVSGVTGFFGAVSRGAIGAVGALAPLAGGLLTAGVSAVAMGVDVKGAMDGVLSQVQAFADNLPTIVNDMVNLLPGFIEQAAALVPAIVTSFTTALTAIANAFPTILPMLVDGLTQAITQLAPLIVTFVPLLLSAGLQLFTALVSSFSKVVPTLVAQLPSMVSQVCGVLVSNLPLLLSAGLELFLALVTAFLDMLPDLIDNLPKLISQVVHAIEGFMPKLLDAGKRLFGKLVEAIPTILSSLLKALGDILSKLPGKVIEWAPKMLNAGKDLIRGMVNGISDMGGWVVDKIKSVCSDALGAVKNFFGIASPSKVMRKMFGFVGEGMALGLDDKASAVSSAMRDIAYGVEREASSIRPNIRLGVAADGVPTARWAGNGASGLDAANEIHALRMELGQVIRDNSKHDYDVNGRTLLEVVDESEEWYR